MRRTLLFVLLTIIASVSAEVEAGPNPYRLVIVADNKAMDRAKEFKNYILSKHPFLAMGNGFEVVVVMGSSERLKCVNGNKKSLRIIKCDAAYVAKIGSENFAHIATVFTSTAKGGRGGSSGDASVASVDYPIATLLHELMHAWGVTDEYEYSESEAQIYCHEDRYLQGPNSVAFKPLPSYSSDANARFRHGADIPWFDKILANTLITNGSNLGSPFLYANNVIGLYRGGNCDRVIPTWRPYNGENIMSGFKTDYINPIQEEVIIKAINAARGIKIIPLPVNNNCADCR